MASTSTPPPPPEADEARNWAELPRDVMAAILKKVGVTDLLQSTQKVCTAWRIISKDPAMWRSIEIRGGGDGFWEEMDYDIEKMARHAVDRSCGQLVELTVEDFGSDELLQYVGDRASQLRHLQLVSTYGISDEGLSEAAKKLPLLEELHIYSSSLSKEALLNVGRCCPRLKSLKFNNHAPNMEYDDEALAIAETMPGLHHLQLFGNKLTNDGLTAILDSCPHLESLDLRQCFNVNLGGTLGKRCSEQIKYLRRPYDSTDDYPSGFSEIDYMSDVDDGQDCEVSCARDVSDYGGLFFDD